MGFSINDSRAVIKARRANTVLEWSLPKITMSRAFVSQSISSTALCLFAALILATSLVSSNRAASGAKQRFSTLEFYWGKQVLPDHPFYSVLMARDRAHLWLASKDYQPRLRLQYAEKRYQMARSLAAENKIDLAVSTLSKSQTYVLDAARQMEVDGLTAQEKTELIAALDHSLYRMQLLHQEYPAVDSIMLRSLQEETANRYKNLSLNL